MLFLFKIILKNHLQKKHKINILMFLCIKFTIIMKRSKQKNIHAHFGNKVVLLF